MSVKSALWAVAVLVAATFVTGVPAASAHTGYQCRNVTGGASGFVGHITDVRVGQHRGFDRFVMQFQGRRVPRFELARQSNARFTQEGRGNVVTLRGSAGIRVTLPRATATDTYSGRRDFRPPFVQLREARQLGDFEAVTNWGLGLRRQSCLRAFTLGSPARLVIDVPH